LEAGSGQVLCGGSIITRSRTSTDAEEAAHGTREPRGVRKAREILPLPVFNYYYEGAHDEITVRENCAAFQRLALHYHVLRGADRSDTTVSVLGHTLRTPILVPPLAFQCMAHPEGELAAARAAGAAGSIYVLATFSTTSVESVVAAASGPVWFQLYVYKDRAATTALVRRAEAAGCSDRASRAWLKPRNTGSEASLVKLCERAELINGLQAE
jgi:hypothetical protein